MNKPDFKFAPAVFVAGNFYQIFIPVKREIMLWIDVGGTDYYDDSNGVLRSDTDIHRVCVPIYELDKAKKYTVRYRVIAKRKPYFTDCGIVKSVEFNFRPLPESGNINIYHIADAHGNCAPAIKAGKYFGSKLDLLVLNGDIIDCSDKTSNFDAIYEIAEALTSGEIPIVFARGNHDLRGIAAEKLTEYTPTVCGKSYYTFRLGRIWGMVLDCAEDKPDDHAEYGNTVCCHSFRVNETRFIKYIIEHCDTEYDASGIEHRLVIVHTPFTFVTKPPFDIEKDIYTEWARLLRCCIKPELMLCGHLHIAAVSKPGSEFDSLGQPCDVIIGSKIESKRICKEIYGTAITLKDGNAEIKFTCGETIFD